MCTVQNNEHQKSEMQKKKRLQNLAKKKILEIHSVTKKGKAPRESGGKTESAHGER